MKAEFSKQKSGLKYIPLYLGSTFFTEFALKNASVYTHDEPLPGVNLGEPPP